MKREYPEQPLVGVGGVVVREGRVLLVQRAREPLKGLWSLPGGLVEVGETLEEALARELREETALSVEAGPLLVVLDRIIKDDVGAIRYHYVLIDYLCTQVEGMAAAGSDVGAVAWVMPGDVASYGISGRTAEVIEQGLKLAANRGAAPTN